MFNNALIHPLPKIMKEHSNYLQAQRCHLDGNLSAMIFIQVNRRSVGGFLTYPSGIVIACQHRCAIWMVLNDIPCPTPKTLRLFFGIFLTLSVYLERSSLENYHRNVSPHFWVHLTPQRSTQMSLKSACKLSICPTSTKRGASLIGFNSLVSEGGPVCIMLSPQFGCITF